MRIIVHRWPILKREPALGGGYTLLRTKKPTANIDCEADERSFARGVCHVRFPDLQGIYDFRLSTGLCTLDSMDAYVLRAEDLDALRKCRDELKKAAG